MYSFNLIDEMWIPCVLPQGKRRGMSLKQVFAGAKDIIEIWDESPLVTASIHRLLLAILHRNCGPEGGAGPENEDEWSKLWNGGNGYWDADRILAYLDKWRQRFDLFDARFPFYQCGSLRSSSTNDQGKSANSELGMANTAHPLASYLNKAVLFDHTTEDIPHAFTSAEAARLLIAFQSFAVGGFSSLSKPRLKGEESAKAGPLLKGAVSLAKGNTLFQTLMLNLHKYNADDDEPFKMGSSDSPAWEREPQPNAQDRKPFGYLDLLTWQSRRVLLVPEMDNSSQPSVRTVIIRKGNQFPEGLTAHDVGDTMLAFRKAEKAGKGEDPWPPLAFRIERGLWRDSTALFQSIEELRERPKVLDWLSDLCAAGIIERSSLYQLETVGMVTDQATIDLWRHERLPLPLRYLEDKNLLDRLKEGLTIAEDSGSALGSSARNLARMIVVPGKDAKEKLGEGQKKDIQNLANSLAIARPYWARLGQAFNHLLLNLADANQVSAEVLSQWATEVGSSARQAFREATDGLDRSARTLKAVARADDEFNHRLNILLSPYKMNQERRCKSMRPTLEDIAFIGKLEGLVPDRGAMAHLRRGLGRPPGMAFEMDRYILTALPENAFQGQADAYYLVAALFAHWHQGKEQASIWEDQGAWNNSLGRSLRIMVEREDLSRQEALEASMEKRLNAMLNCHLEDLPAHLRRIVSLLKAKEVPIHWAQLLGDVQAWHTESRFVQHEWAKGFWITRRETPTKATLKGI